jgi:hypothetical protein
VSFNPRHNLSSTLKKVQSGSQHNSYKQLYSDKKVDSPEDREEIPVRIMNDHYVIENVDDIPSYEEETTKIKVCVRVRPLLQPGER